MVARKLQVLLIFKVNKRDKESPPHSVDLKDWPHEDDYNPGISIFKGVAYNLTEDGKNGEFRKQVDYIHAFPTCKNFMHIK